MHFPKPQRRPELDALRGLFLVWMTLTHLPTRFSDFVNQPIGFVSSAEGFVFLSALLVGRVYMRLALESGAALRAMLWRRSLRIYAYHLLMLALAFTVAAAYAVRTHHAAIYNLLNFYIAHPFVAAIGSVLLLYCPPLLDILPMYVIFLFFTPLVLTSAVKQGWGRILAVSATFWLFAQFGLRDIVHNIIVHITHLPIPLQETGAFNLFAWQAVWIAGLWIGAKSATDNVPLKRIPGYAVAICAVVCLFFIGVRHGLLGPHLTQQSLGMKLDKWQIGPLRVINLITFTVVFYWLRKYVLRIVAIEPFLTLGKASLHVFCAHVFFVFVGLALLYNDVPELHGGLAIALLAITFTGLIFVAGREVRKQRAERFKREIRKGEALPATRPNIYIRKELETSLEQPHEVFH
ncbi:MAG TPA: OpgC domain-containing protein [Pseudacidobacterium sp.]|nr:OpgC domain-containing protein [Pseudacidobacterium sp.]